MDPTPSVLNVGLAQIGGKLLSYLPRFLLYLLPKMMCHVVLSIRTASIANEIENVPCLFQSTNAMVEWIVE